MKRKHYQPNTPIGALVQHLKHYATAGATSAIISTGPQDPKDGAKCWRGPCQDTPTECVEFWIELAKPKQETARHRVAILDACPRHIKQAKAVATRATRQVLPVRVEPHHIVHNRRRVFAILFSLERPWL